MGLAEEAEALAGSLGLGNAARAVRDEVATARRIVRANLNDASAGLHVAHERLQTAVAAGASGGLASSVTDKLGYASSLVGGGSSSCASVCEVCALPFTHGTAVQREIHTLQAAMDRCPEEGALVSARAQLKELDGSLGELSADGGRSSTLSTPLGDGAVAAAGAATVVAELLARELRHDDARAKEEAEATKRALAAREDFLRRMEAERAAEQEQLRQREHVDVEPLHEPGG